MYIDVVSDKAVDTKSDDTINWAYTSWQFNTTAAVKYCEWYLTNEYLDLSIEANRLKFRSAAGKPVDLGTDGSTPTGTAPFMYMRNPYDSFDTNNGSGGGWFSLTGTLIDGGADIP